MCFSNVRFLIKKIKVMEKIFGIVFFTVEKRLTKTAT